MMAFMRWLRYLRLKLQRKLLRPLRHWDRRIEEFATDLLYDRRKSAGTVVCGSALRGLSHIFSGVVRLRHHCYRHRILKSQYLGCMVITVGNITVGGTGKTPVVEKLAQELSKRGRKVAILSRGYRSRTTSKFDRCWRKISNQAELPPRVVSDGKTILLNSELAGDEPFMLAKNLPGVVVLTDKNRVKAGQFAIRHFGCDTLLLDDGYQYLRLRGQLNILLVDKSNPFGNSHLLPRGILREPLQQIRRADYILLTKSDGSPDPKLIETLQKFKRPMVPIIESSHVPQRLQAVEGEGTLPMESLLGKRVATFSGIAVPESFENFIRQRGGVIVYNRRFPDHYRFSEQELSQIFEMAQAQQAEFVVTTEKDAVRLPERWLYPLPLYYLRIEVQILRGEKEFQSILNRLCDSDHFCQPFGEIVEK